MERWIQDIRYTGRTLARQPVFTSIAVLTIGLGIAANTSIFSVVRAVLLKPLPYANPEQLVVVWANLTARDRPKFSVSPPDLRDLQEQTTQFTDFAGITTFQQTLTGGQGVPEQIDVAGVTANFLTTLGVRMALGADAGSILRLVVRQKLVLTAIGLAAGLVGGILATRLIASLLVGVSPTDPVTFAVVGSVFVAVGIAATYAPALRATRVDPVVALREG